MGTLLQECVGGLCSKAATSALLTSQEEAWIKRVSSKRNESGFTLSNSSYESSCLHLRYIDDVILASRRWCRTCLVNSEESSVTRRKIANRLELNTIARIIYYSISTVAAPVEPAKPIESPNTRKQQRQEPEPVVNHVSSSTSVAHVPTNNSEGPPTEPVPHPRVATTSSQQSR